jgi:eukaryotic-like serine/threonine-protein kinase
MAMPTPTPSRAALPPGTLVARRYRVEAVAGSGGYARVYRATDLLNGGERALKEVADPDADADPGSRAQLELEAALLIDIGHPNIPRGYQLVEDHGGRYLVMEYVRGQDLDELLHGSLARRGAPLDEAHVLGWMAAVCGALGALHALRPPIVHGDITPANIKIAPDAPAGRPVLLDFGLAAAVADAAAPQGHIYQAADAAGATRRVSPGFAPPERYLAAWRPDVRTDVYGAGATLYACLTGEDPPEAPARLLALAESAGGEDAALVPPRRRNPRLSGATDRAITQALALAPPDRQQTARQLRDELCAALAALAALRSR